MNKIDAKLWKEIQMLIAPDPIKTHENMYELISHIREEAVEEYKKDRERLDFLDKCNQQLNKVYGTDYGWELILTHNVTRLMRGYGEIDLNDQKGGNDKGKSCRDAIDKQMDHSYRSV